jgi:hypothetical protein
MTRIVTTTYRYKRPPKKRKAVALEVPAVVTTTDDPDTDAVMRAWLERAKWGHGPA